MTGTLDQNSADDESGGSAVVGARDGSSVGCRLGERRLEARAPQRLERLRQKLFGTARSDHRVGQAVHDRERGTRLAPGAEREQRVERQSLAHHTLRVVHAGAEQRRRSHGHHGPKAGCAMEREERGERAARRQADGGHPRGVDAHARRSVVDHRDDHIELAAAGLCARMKPVPAAEDIREPALLGAEQPYPGTVGEARPAGGEGEAQRTLLAAMQDDDQRRGLVVAESRRCV